MRELTVLQAVRLKGRVTAARIATTLTRDEAELAPVIADLVDAGMLVEGKTLRLSPDGRQRLNELLAEERRGIDTTTITHAYNDFRHVNAEFKSLVTEWQMKDGEPNDHQDVDYDASVLARLDRVHDAILSTIAAVTAQLPRLSAYADKLSGALRKIKAGDTMWFTRPLIDSYHTVWFELHEELILAAGLTREDEARAGDAQ
jgi:hypothetical protein